MNLMQVVPGNHTGTLKGEDGAKAGIDGLPCTSVCELFADDGKSKLPAHTHRSFFKPLKV